MKKSIIRMGCIVLVTALLGSCYYDKADLLYPGGSSFVDCTTVPASFSANVKPMIINQCSSSGCHDISASGGLTFSNYDDIKNNITRIKVRALDEKSMPTSGPLSTADQNMLKCWIESGTPNN